jgi:hypothetical protein
MNSGQWCPLFFFTAAALFGKASLAATEFRQGKPCGHITTIMFLARKSNVGDGL